MTYSSVLSPRSPLTSLALINQFIASVGIYCVPRHKGNKGKWGGVEKNTGLLACRLPTILQRTRTRAKCDEKKYKW
jgi:hypothetical protein